MSFLFFRPRVLQLLVVLVLGYAVGTPLLAQERGDLTFQGVAISDTATSGAFDEGRLWSVADPPLDTFARRYGVKADEAWVEHLRRGTLRLPSCTAALASTRGLALTTARCVRAHLEEASTNDAGPLSEERPVPELYADRLLTTRDVTAEVQAVSEDSSVSLPQARTTVQQRLQRQAEDGRQVEVDAEAGGTTFTAYVYRRYQDLRLVFLPEREMSQFGGIEEALTYPRHALNVAVLRVYTEDGTPLETDHFFDVRTQGVRPAETVFALGHPTATDRGETQEQVAVQRDVVLPALLAHLQTWESAFQAYLDTSAAPGAWRHELYEGQRTRKDYQLRLESLQDDSLMTRLQQRDEQLRRVLQNDGELSDEHGGLLDSLAAIQKEKRQHAEEYKAFGALEDSPYSSATLRRALLAHRAEEVTGVHRDRLIQQFASIASQPVPVDAALLAAHWELIQSHVQADAAGVPEDEEDVEEWARSVVETSLFARPEEARTALQSDALSADDPARSFVAAFDSSYTAFRDAWTELERREKKLTRRLHRARAEVQDSSIKLPGDRAPRLTAGQVRGFPYNGTLAPPFSTFYGLFAQHHAFGGEGEWDLPEAWQSGDALARSQPLNVVSSTDWAGGMSGSPLLNQYLQIVGLIFDGNAQSAAGEYLFLPSYMRTVSVDLRGFQEALTTMYEADDLVEELFGAPEARNDSPR